MSRGGFANARSKVEEVYRQSEKCGNDNDAALTP